MSTSNNIHPKNTQYIQGEIHLLCSHRDYNHILNISISFIIKNTNKFDWNLHSIIIRTQTNNSSHQTFHSLLTHLSPFFLYLFLTAAHAALWGISSALWRFPPRLLAGFLYCSTALACTLVKICCACLGKVSIYFLVDSAVLLPDLFLLDDFLSFGIWYSAGHNPIYLEYMICLAWL